MAGTSAVTIALSCTSATPADRGGRERPPPAAVAGSDCRNETEAAADPSLRPPGGLTGDVDGDGERDRVSLAIDEAADPRCRHFVVVAAGGTTYSTAVRHPELDPTLGLPAVRILAALDARPGFEVVVDVAAGASTTLSAVYGFDGRMLERVVFESGDPATDDLVAHGGSAGHLEAAQCIDGSIVMSSAVARARKGWTVQRRFFRPAAGALVHDPDGSERLRVSGRGLRGLLEFGTPPLSLCR